MWYRLVNLGWERGEKRLHITQACGNDSDRLAGACHVPALKNTFIHQQNEIVSSYGNKVLFVSIEFI